MKQMLGEEYDAFLRSYEDTRRPGLRVNTLREKAKTLESSSLFAYSLGTSRLLL